MQRLLKELFDTYYQDVYRYLYSLSRDAALSEDLTSEVFLEVVKSIHQFRGESDVKTWLYSIARHRWFAHLRKKKRQAGDGGYLSDCTVELHAGTEAARRGKKIAAEIYLSEFLESREMSPEDACLYRELLERIHELLKKETERTRNIVEMRMDGYSFHEIGIAFGISESSARVIDFRAKTKIRQILKKEGFDIE